jgi:hypothetical protein
MVESLIVRKGFISFIFLTKNPHRNRWGFFIFQLLVSPGYPSPSPGRPQSRFCLEKGYMTLIVMGKIQTKFESETSGELV